VVGRGGGGLGTVTDVDASTTEDPEPRISHVSSTVGEAVVPSGNGSSYVAAPEPAKLV
jgi:hypothetical protein